jgi:hypothetical protein
MPNNFLSCLTSFAKDKLGMSEREKQLVTALNSVLPRLGYRVVPSTGVVHGNDRRSSIAKCDHAQVSLMSSL